jgi:hypothetical protein
MLASKFTHSKLNNSARVSPSKLLQNAKNARLKAFHLKNNT